MQSTRRDLLRFAGQSSVMLAFATLFPRLAEARSPKKMTPAWTFTPLKPFSADTVNLVAGLESRLLIAWDDVINEKGERFGTNNDFLALIPLNDAKTEAVMWVNHESFTPFLVTGRAVTQAPTKEQVIKEQMCVGGSLLKIKKVDGKWVVVKNDPLNRRIDARTPIPFAGGKKVYGSSIAIGTLGNCGGGVTPWKTILTCEENYDEYYGEVEYDSKARNRRHLPSIKCGWEKHFAYPPEHYGWVCEVDPMTGTAKKHTSLGRFAHESATAIQAKDGRCVVYMGDDEENRCLYKFISEKPGSLDAGTLYVVSLGLKKWIPLIRESHESLKRNFADQLDVMIRCRQAAVAVGGSLLDRPEDIEIEPGTNALYISLTNSANRGNPHGSIMRLVEKGSDPLSLDFEFSTFLQGGIETGITCPDSLAFDNKGNLWVCTDISGKLMNKPPYTEFRNNSLFVVPVVNGKAGQPKLVALAPHDAEFTGPCFSPDGETLFLSVQHPGDELKSLEEPTSSWPGGGSQTPRSAVIAVTGKTLAMIQT